MARITVEDCVDKFPSRFELVLVASQRSRKLHAGDQPTVEKENDKNTVISLREIASESIPISDMKNNLIEEYQTVTIVDEEDENNNIDLDSKDEKSTSADDDKISEEVDQEIKKLAMLEDEKINEGFYIEENKVEIETEEKTEETNQNIS